MNIVKQTRSMPSDVEGKTGSSGCSRRRVLDVMAAGGLASMLGGLPMSAMAAAADDVLRIGYLPITDATALLAAHAMGYFEEEGLRVAKPTMIKGWTSLVRGFAGGNFNLVHLLKPIPVWMRYNNNFPVKIMAWAHTNGSAIVVGKDTGIEDFKDLGGRRVAIPYWYSMHNIILQEGLRKVGIKPVIDKGGAIAADSCALMVTPPSFMVRALALGRIDGYMVAEPFNAMGELSAGGKIMRFSGDIWRNHPCCVVCMHEQDTVQRPQWSQKVVNAIVRAEIFAANNKAQVAHMLSKDGKGYLPVSAQVLERAMTFYDASAYASPNAIRHNGDQSQGRIDFTPYPYPSATRLIVKMMNNTMVEGRKHFLNKVSPDFVADDLVNYDFIKMALEKYPEWKQLPGVDSKNPFEREEVLNV
jgi:NitT/TauT family transport system substrate-binding protein